MIQPPFKLPTIFAEDFVYKFFFGGSLHRHMLFGSPFRQFVGYSQFNTTSSGIVVGDQPTQQMRTKPLIFSTHFFWQLLTKTLLKKHVWQTQNPRHNRQLNVI